MMLLHETARSSLSLIAGTYVYAVCALGADHVVAICSDDSVRILDAQSLAALSGRTELPAHAGITCLTGASDPSTPYLTAGRDGCIRGWDARVWAAAFEIKDAAASPFLSLASNPGSFAVAAGTELVNAQATVQVWDWRNAAAPAARFVESHSDDVTEVAFHPERPTRLLSGSTDGLVNLYDLTAADEDDALAEVLKHASVHRAGFLRGVGGDGTADGAVYALSHDETLAVFAAPADDGAGAELGDPAAAAAADAPAAPPRRVRAWGDVRPRTGCEYAVDVLPPPLLWGAGAGAEGESLLVAGNHSEQRLDLVPFGHAPEADFRPQDALRLVGAHGEDVVRSLLVHVDGTTIFTGGEDGLVKAWRGEAAERARETDEQAETRKKRRKKSIHKERHFRPY